MIKRKYIVILIYIIIILLIYLYKPSMIFNLNGELKKFGYENDEYLIPKSLLSMEIIVPSIGIIIYIISLCIEIIII